MWSMKALLPLLLWFASACLGLDLTTTDGKVYKDVSLVRRSGGQVRFMHHDGTAVVPESKLPAGWIDSAIKPGDYKARELAQAEMDRMVADSQTDRLQMLKQWCDAHPDGGQWTFSNGGISTLDKWQRDRLMEIATALENIESVGAALSFLKEASASAYAEARDKALMLLADIGLECLVELKSPGCEWLALCDELQSSQEVVA